MTPRRSVGPADLQPPGSDLLPRLAREGQAQPPLPEPATRRNWKAGIPLLHACGKLDPALKDQTQVIAKRYKDLGGQITVILQEGEGHYPLAPRDPRPVVEFVVTKSK